MDGWCSGGQAGAASLRSLRISVISALNTSRDYCYAEITELRRDRRED